MKNKLIRIVIVAAMIITFSSPLIKVYASDSLIDLIGLARNKVLSIVNIASGDQYSQIENKTQAVENNTLNYIDAYIKGLDNELNSYANSQSQEAQNKLNTQYENIKATLDNERQGLIDEGKKNIKANIDQKYQKELEKLNNKLDIQFKDKFK